VEIHIDGIHFKILWDVACKHCNHVYGVQQQQCEGRTRIEAYDTVLNGLLFNERKRKEAVEHPSRNMVVEHQI